MRKPILFSAAALALIAADAPPAPPPGHQRPTPEEIEAHRAEREAKRSADIALLLGLRADQKAGLDAYLKTMAPPYRDWGGHGGPEGAPPPPSSEGTLAKLDHMSRAIDRHDADAKQRIDATRRFYASLTSEQQQRFDALERLRHGGMHGPHEHGRHGGPDGPPPPMKG